MIKKSGIIKLVAASLIFAAFDIWIYASLLGSYRKYESTNSLKEVSLFAKTVPADSEDLDEWVAGLPSIIEGGKVLLLNLDENFNFYPVAGDALCRALWEAQKDSADFEEGLMSVYYLVPHSLKQSFKVPQLRALAGVDEASVLSSMKVHLLPIPDESGWDISGAVMMAVPENLAFEKLLRNLFLLAWVIFTVLFAVAALARDPITGYAVIFLFGMALTFVAYPLIESVRLTFIQEGKITLNISFCSVRETTAGL